MLNNKVSNFILITEIVVESLIEKISELQIFVNANIFHEKTPSVPQYI